MGINPIRIIGNWDEGYALDIHTITSTPIGQDIYRHMRYDTKRSEMGELLYGFKYKGIYENLFQRCDYNSTTLYKKLCQKTEQL
jgi:competence protein ComFC